MKQFMPELTPDMRLAALRDNCDRRETEKYDRELSQHEMDQRREQLADNCIAVNGFEDELKEVKADFKAKMDPLKEDNKKLLKEIKSGRAEEEGDLYYMADHENGMMEVYDESGDMIRSRRLTPDEKQGRLFPVRKAV